MKLMGRKLIVSLLLFFGICFLIGNTVLAAPIKDHDMTDGEKDGEHNLERIEEKTKEELLGDLDVTEINRMLAEIFPQERLDFMDMVTAVLRGEMELDANLFNRMIKDQFFYVFQESKKSIVSILLIAIAAALFFNFSSVFQTRQVSEISFFLLYMLLIAVCLASFMAASDWVEEGIRIITDFMKILCPIFFAAVTIAKGSLSAAAFYHLTLILILAVELIVLNILFPLIHVYVMVRILNSLQKEDYLSKCSELLETVIGWILKAMLGGMIGLNVIQGLVAPVIDSVKRSILTRGMEVIPGIGDGLSGTAEVILGTAVVIKNSIGVVGVTLVALLCLSPLLQVGLITLAYKFTAAVVQPLSDERIVECISGVGEGCHLLLRSIFTCAVLFLLTIAIISYITSSV